MTVAVESVVKGISLNISTFLKQNHHIPDYQRDFTWNTRLITQLWVDLVGLYERSSKNDVLAANPEGYYLGAIVAIAQANATDDVVDGQQRLTALNTLVTVLIDKVKSLPAKYQQMGLVNTLEQLVSQGLVNGNLAARLSFSDSEMNEFYLNSTVRAQTPLDRKNYWNSAKAQILLKRSKGKSPMALLKAALETHQSELDSFLQGLSVKQQGVRIALFSRIISECVVVLKITAGSYSNAYTIFESLNFRGAPLSQADLIKNELLKISTPSAQAHIVSTWRDLKKVGDDIGIVTLPEMIYLSHISRFDRIASSRLFEDVKTKAGQSAKAVAYMDNVRTDANSLLAMKECQPSFWTDDTKLALNDIFDVLGAKLVIPFLMSAYRKKGQHKNSASEFESLVKIAMNFTYRYMKLGAGDTGAFSKAINEAALAIENNSSASSISSALKKYAPDHEFREQFKKFSTDRPKLAYFSLYWLERVLVAGKGATPVLHGVQQNIEHIMPKKPDANWPAAVALKSKDAEEFDYQLWRIGNMIPLPASLNKSIKNKSIKDKLPAYQKTNLASPAQVVNYTGANGTVWDEAAIERRQSALAATAIKAWAL